MSRLTPLPVQDSSLPSETHNDIELTDRELRNCYDDLVTALEHLREICHELSRNDPRRHRLQKLDGKVGDLGHGLIDAHKELGRIVKMDVE